jgi:hypothetical protein
MTCPICDKKTANCDCTALEREQFEQLQNAQIEQDLIEEEAFKRGGKDMLNYTSSHWAIQKIITDEELFNYWVDDYEAKSHHSKRSS